MVSKYYHNFDILYQKTTTDFLFAKEAFHSLEKLVQDFLSKKILPYADIKNDLNVLITGVGEGVLAHKLSSLEKVKKITGIDISSYALKIAKENFSHSKIHYVEQDFTQMVVEDAHKYAFDLIVDNHLLHCLLGDTDRHAYFHAVKKVLKKEGFFLFESIVSDDGIYPENCYLDDKGIFWQETTDKNLHNLFRNDEGKMYVPTRQIPKAIQLEEEIKNAGFEILYFIFRSDLRGTPFTTLKEDAENQQGKGFPLVQAILAVPNEES